MNKKKKPHDCRCQFPDVVHSDITGHASECPTLHRSHRRQTLISINRDGSETVVEVGPMWPGMGSS